MESHNQAKNVNFAQMLESLLEMLSSREKDVLRRRHALSKGSNRKETLEKIGQEYKVTRERVRQIERDGIKKLKEKMSDTSVSESLGQIEETVRTFLHKYGGAMEEGHLLDNLVDFFGLSANPNASAEELLHHKKALSFLISHLLADKFERVSEHDDFHPTWKLKEAPWELVEEVIDRLVSLMGENGKPLSAEELFRVLKEHESYKGLSQRLTGLQRVKDELVDVDEAILSYLRASKKIKRNLFGQVGLSHWNTISPKRMNDKIYLVLKEAGKPLHFTDIAELINKTGFDHKKALPATIHNELILDDRYVLIGRGIYALREWGYEPGTVSDVISVLLKQRGPLTKDAITEAVSKQRMVKKATVNLALMNKDRFKKLADKRYGLVV